MIEILAVAALAMVFDVATGVAAAAKTGTVKSGKMREGLWHKAGFVGLVIMSFMAEYAAAHIPTDGIEIPAFADFCAFVDAMPLVAATCGFIVVTEAISILENLCVLNPAIAKSPIGKFLAAVEDPAESGR